MITAGLTEILLLWKHLVTMILILIIILQAVLDVSCLNVHNVTCNLKTTSCKCRESADVCVFNLQITQLHTFMRYQIHDEINELGTAGKIHYFDDKGDLRSHPLSVVTTCVNVTEDDTSCTPAFTVDGVTFRSFIAVNGQMPGPTLIVFYNQVIEVKVVNGLEDESTTMHWHGLRQNNTPWMDGMEHLTQCTIPPGSSFNYIFKAYPSGTFWYHSHTKTQRTDGMYGGFIILERNMKEIKTKLGAFRDEPEQHSIFLSEWFPQSANIYMREASSGSNFFYSRPPGPNDLPYLQISPDGVQNGDLFFWSALINGKGKNPDNSRVPYIKSRLSIFTVNPGEVYRFRFIGVTNFLFRLSVDEHQLRVIATDGYLIQPVITDYIIISSGERYDFLLQAKNKSQLRDIGKNNFWIRAELLAIEHGVYPWGPLPGVAPYRLLSENSAEAILYYNVSGTQPPKSSEYESIKNASIPHSRKCSHEQPCQAVNCPFMFHSTYNMSCIYVHQLKLLFPALVEELPLNEPEADQGREIFFNFGTEGVSRLVAVNGRTLTLPTTPLQLITDPTELKELADKEFCNNDPNVCKNAPFLTALPACKCVYVEDLPVFGSTTRIVLTTVVQDSYSHPVHFHGHNFFVMDMGFPEYNSSTGVRGCYKDLDCSVPSGIDPCKYTEEPTHQNLYYTCNYPKWKNGHRPFYGDPFSKIDPYTVRKDSVGIPAGGYIVIQFVTNNPGYWFLHCHMEGHSLVGMAVIINEVPERHSPPPTEMRKCGNFNWSLEEFYKSTKAAMDWTISTKNANHNHNSNQPKPDQSSQNQRKQAAPKKLFKKKVENRMQSGLPQVMMCEVVPFNSNF